MSANHTDLFGLTNEQEIPSIYDIVQVSGNEIVDFANEVIRTGPGFLRNTVLFILH